jgi:hypothetical protein
MEYTALPKMAEKVRERFGKLSKDTHKGPISVTAESCTTVIYVILNNRGGRII